METVIDVSHVIEPMLEDQNTLSYLRDKYSMRYKKLVEDFDDEDNTATYYLCIYHLCKENNTSHFMIEGDIYTIAE